MGTRGIEDFLEGAMGEDTVGFDRDIEGVSILASALEQLTRAGVEVLDACCGLGEGV